MCWPLLPKALTTPKSYKLAPHGDQRFRFPFFLWAVTHWQGLGTEASPLDHITEQMVKLHSREGLSVCLWSFPQRNNLGEG